METYLLLPFIEQVKELTTVDLVVADPQVQLRVFVRLHVGECVKDVARRQLIQPGRHRVSQQCVTLAAARLTERETSGCRPVDTKDKI